MQLQRRCRSLILINKRSLGRDPNEKKTMVLGCRLPWNFRSGDGLRRCRRKSGTERASEEIPGVQVKHSANVEQSEETEDGGMNLISSYLRQADSSEQFLKNFAKALKARNGAVARLFLTPELRHEIKPRVIGVSTPLKNIDINHIDSNQYQLTAYFSPYCEKPEQLAFQWRVAVEPESSGGTYFITSLQRLKDVTNNAW